MQDDFDRNDPVDEAEDELPPGMRIIDGDETPDELSDEKSPKEDSNADLLDEEPPLNLNEEFEKEEV